jgi:hypothetical protein
VAQVIKGDATIPGHGWELLKPLPPVIGIAERVGHTAALATHQSAFIGVWLAIKTLGVAPWQHEKPEGRYAYQRNLVVTLVSLGWGAIGAQAIWWLRADPAQWLDTVVLIGVAVLACGALWSYLRQAVPAAAQRYVDARSTGHALAPDRTTLRR